MTSIPDYPNFLTHDSTEDQRLFFKYCQNGNSEGVKKALHHDWHMKTLSNGTQYCLESQKNDYLNSVYAIFDYVLSLKKAALDKLDKLPTQSKNSHEAILSQETDYETNAYLSAIFSYPQKLLPHSLAQQLLGKIIAINIPLDFSLQSYFRQRINECNIQALSDILSNPLYENAKIITSTSVFSVLYRNINQENIKNKKETLLFLINCEKTRPELKKFIENDKKSSYEYKTKTQWYESLIQDTYQQIISHEEKTLFSSTLPIEPQNMKDNKKIKNKI